MVPFDYRLLTQAQRREVRLRYQEEQNDQCYYCGAPLEGYPAPSVRLRKIDRRLFPKGFFKNPVHLHHDHRTGMTIGTVHAYCNAVMWQYHGQ